MAYDEQLAERVRTEVSARADHIEKRMFGGICFMVRGHMCCGVTNEDLMLRLGVEAADEAMAEPGIRQMDFTGRPMTGYVFASGVAVERDALGAWIERALDFVGTLPEQG
jgi:hypothetical protein